MFYGREQELALLNRRYVKNHFECIVIYGRRRIGKTALINAFCKDKKTIYFSAINASSTENLEALSKAIGLCQMPEQNHLPVYQRYEDAFDAITAIAEREKIVFVIDEYPYLAKSDSTFSSRLQHIIDHVWQNKKVFLILCGSSMSFMENQVLGYESPLYGRRTAQIKLQAMTYKEMTVFHPSLCCEDQALLYGITGGIPHYINKLEIDSSIDDALLENLFDPSGYLFEEPENLLKQELREPAIYNSIIAAIAGGASRLNEITTKAGVNSTGACLKYLKALSELGIIHKETPITCKPGKKTIYAIDDNFYRFWYRFVRGNISIINAGMVQRIYNRIIKPGYPDYMGHIFESMCRTYLMRYAENLPFVLQGIGRWWGSDPVLKKEVEIDIVGVPAECDTYLICSCKYRNEKTGCDELALLQRYADTFRKNGHFQFVIFSKSGFTEDLLRKEKAGEVLLYTLEDLYSK